MAATDHTRLRTARPSADTKSTDISRNLPPGIDTPSGADPACNAGTTARTLRGSTDAESTDGAAPGTSKPLRGLPVDPAAVRAPLRVTMVAASIALQ